MDLRHNAARGRVGEPPYASTPRLTAERENMGGDIDPRVARTARAFEQAVVALAAERPVSQITVAELAHRAGLTRATFYNRYNSPLDLLIRILYADLDRGHRLEEEQRATGAHTSAAMLRLATGHVADHVERFESIYRQAMSDPADGGVYEALVRHFADYSLAFMAAGDGPELTDGARRVVAQFMAHGFAGAIRAWLDDASMTKEDLIDVAVACAPAWWR
ncbi:TetR/AcrR family transcriptional regulator [Actinacidiphila alni]|uniref:TetR/AcrR family transcriptional regulator n=1 Tax=Actinacidiphila alni TaxID=380248 RepID=UPI0033C762C0